SMGAILFAFAFLFLAGATPVTVAIFAVIFGMGDGLRAIIRGTLPLALFGSKNYGARLGWVSFIRMGVNASAPFAFAALIEGYGPWVSFAVMAGCVGTGLAALAMIPRPIPTPSAP
ncbi:MAG: MFS transporter, partial [Pseudomonadota bacterium]